MGLRHRAEDPPPAPAAIGAERGGGRPDRGGRAGASDLGRTLLGRHRANRRERLVRGVHVLWFGGWIAWNGELVSGWRPVDPFPFSFLTLVVSLEAIFLSIFVLVSQNHLTRRGALRPGGSRWKTSPAGGADAGAEARGDPTTPES